MLEDVNIFGGVGGRKRTESRNINDSMKRHCRVGKAVGLDDILSLRMLEEKIEDNLVKFQQQISEKRAELGNVKLLKIVQTYCRYIYQKKIVNG